MHHDANRSAADGQADDAARSAGQDGGDEATTRERQSCRRRRHSGVAAAANILGLMLDRSRPEWYDHCTIRPARRLPAGPTPKPTTYPGEIGMFLPRSAVRFTLVALLA